MVRVEHHERVMLTHEAIPAGTIPTAFDPNGVYPYVSFVETARRPMARRYRLVTLENAWIRATICPDLGGRVTSLIHRSSGREVLFMPDVIRPVRILPRFGFVPGGIEVSCPIAHSPVGAETVLMDVTSDPARTNVTCGERELRHGLQWSVEYSLGRDDQFLTQRLLVDNPGNQSYPWTSWSNAALPSFPDTEFHFPAGQVLAHASALRTIDWLQDGPRSEADVREMTGYFWKTRSTNRFGAYTPSLGCGLYHVADECSAPGMKLWTYGTGADRDWATLGTADGSAYLEIQGGPVADQSMRRELGPGETHVHVEYWIPTDRPLDIHQIDLPAVELRPSHEIPRFGWARPDEVAVWEQLAELDRAPYSPPHPSTFRWAPSGLEDLEPDFRRAIELAPPETADLWRFHFGTWLAGRGEAARAIDVLSKTTVDVGRVLLGRLLRLQGQLSAARAAMGGVEETWVRLHPQVVVERDVLLRAIGDETLEERAAWLARVAAIDDEAVMERRVQLLIDHGKAQAAKELLLRTPFQKVHQSYTRTDLWRQICLALGEPETVAPRQLGEDRLARFGAYREFEA